MRILAVGGGSGGHVTPVVAVIRELRQAQPKAEIKFWCDRKFAPQARSIIGAYDRSIPVQLIFAGKFRRYHHISPMRQIFWPSLVLRNIGDAFLVLAGFIQSFFKLLLWRPNVIFAKGGYVCLPVGMAAKLLGIPIVIHDSDAYPGLTNRVLGKWASGIATGAPLEYYRYPANRARYVGIPISDDFHKFSNAEKVEAKKQWGISTEHPLLVVTGGGLGASRINEAIVLKLDNLLEICSVILVAGELQYDELRSISPANSDRFQLLSFVSKGMASLLGAADVVVARAGATTILELAALQKPTILVPNARLTGGHQIKNADVYKTAGAVKIVNEDDMVKAPQVLVDAIKELINNYEKSTDMARKFAEFARPNAAADVAQMVIESAR